MDGVVNLLKPPGMTSRQAVSVVKRLTGAKKAGHAGTLDPGAAGVLPVMLGKATRLFDLLGDEGKEYIGEFTFGRQTDTQDSYGKLLGQEDTAVTEEQVEAVLPQFTGKIAQTPSAFSAVHIDGKRAYDYAHRGIAVELPSRIVTVHALELMAKTGDQSYLFRVACGKGTYIRSLCVDMAAALGTVGYLSFLLRSRTGGFALDTSVTLDELEERGLAAVMGLSELLAGFPRLTAHVAYDKALKNGVRLPLNACAEQAVEGVRYCIYTSEDELVGTAYRSGNTIYTKANLRTE